MGNLYADEVGKEVIVHHRKMYSIVVSDVETSDTHYMFDGEVMVHIDDVKFTNVRPDGKMRVNYVTDCLTIGVLVANDGQNIKIEITNTQNGQKYYDILCQKSVRGVKVKYDE